jgi:hypothetical protein
MNSITPALIDYWQKLPARSAASRRRSLEEARRRVDAGERGADSLVPYALADHDEDVVFAATAAYVGVIRDAGDRNAAAHDAAEWVRRGLAINRGAVFAALLALGDDGVNERLLPLRLALSEEEVATVCRRAARKPCERSRAFLHEWHELLGEAALDAGRHYLSGVLVAA